MPQLVKGGKHVFGWSRVGPAGTLRIPHEAIEEYDLKDSERLIGFPGSRTSGGFALGSERRLKDSPLTEIPELPKKTHGDEQETRHPVQRRLFKTVLEGDCVTLPTHVLAHYGIHPRDRLLVIRGSGLAVGFAVRGPIVEEARKHADLSVLDPD